MVPPHQEADALAATKFSPPRSPAGWIDRPRLRAALEEGLGGPLTLVAAGAGAGKSAMLGAWAAQRTCDGPLAWLSLEPADADRRRFWRAVFEAFRRAGAAAPVGSLALHPAEDLDLAIPALVNALETLGEPVVLVLDDLHELGDSPAVADLDRLLRHPPRNLRVVISTRIDPALRIGRLRLEGTIRELREADLAFTLDEAAALLAAAGTELEPESLRRLWERTEGWAAGLRLAALTLRDHPDPAAFVAAFAGDDLAMADYLVTEVLARQPPELVAFLLRASVVGEMSADLAAAVTGDPRAPELAGAARARARARLRRRRPRRAVAPLPSAAARAARHPAAPPAAGGDPAPAPSRRRLVRRRRAPRRRPAPRGAGRGVGPRGGARRGALAAAAAGRRDRLPARRPRGLSAGAHRR